MKSTLHLCLFLILFCPLLSLSQNVAQSRSIVIDSTIKTVSIINCEQGIYGKVTSITGDPLVAASAVVVGTATGVVTGTDGSYVMFMPAGSYTIRVTYVGCVSQEILVVVPSCQGVRLDVKLDCDALTLNKGSQKWYPIQLDYSPLFKVINGVHHVIFAPGLDSIFPVNGPMSFPKK